MIRYEKIKRMLDIILVLAISPFFIILLPVVAFFIKAESRGPVFYRAKRISAGRMVEILKFRTMINGAETQKEELDYLNERRDGPFFKITKDPRVTKTGRILRKFWLDELPQIINVLKGDISMVGPRPYEPGEVEKYPEAFRFLKFEKAGITGLSQVRGSSNLPFDKVLEYDSYYARHKSLWLDCQILGKTLLLLLKPSGV